MEIHLCIPIEYKVNSFLSHSLIDAPIPVATEILIYIIDDNDTAIWQWPNCFTIIHRLHGKGTGFRQSTFTTEHFAAPPRAPQWTFQIRSVHITTGYRIKLPRGKLSHNWSGEWIIDVVALKRKPTAFGRKN